MLGADINVSYVDTIADLAMDASGSLLAGLALIVWRARYRAPGSAEGVVHARP